MYQYMAWVSSRSLTAGSCGGFAPGVRFFDTSETYHSEAAFKRWFQQEPAVRKQIFLVTKDTPKTPPNSWGMLDKRLAALGTDYVDLFFIHGFGNDYPALVDAEWPWSRAEELKEAVGGGQEVRARPGWWGSRRHRQGRRAAVDLEAAAESGVIDAIMLQYRPWLDKDSPLNKAIDAAWNKGDRADLDEADRQPGGDKPKGDHLKEVVQRVPVLAERKLSPFQGLLHAIWTEMNGSVRPVSR